MLLEMIYVGTKGAGAARWLKLRATLGQGSQDRTSALGIVLNGVAREDSVCVVPIAYG